MTDSGLTKFDCVTVVGAGLLGASLGLALKARGLAGVVRGVGHRASSLETALRTGAIDEAFQDTRAAVAGADLIVLCTPVGLILEKLDEIRPVCSPDVLVTDVGSTKSVICRHAEETWGRPLRFVGSHPMAGSEKFGAGHARADFYEGCRALVTATPETDPEAAERVRALWRAVGATVVDLDPQIHDVLVARTSHIPHVVAACVAELAADAGDVRALVGNGFRDVTRIAEGRPEIWRDICLTNRDAILEGLLRLGEMIDEARRRIAGGSPHEIESLFEAGRVARKKALGE